MYRFTTRQITGFFLRQDCYLPKTIYIMQPPVDREPDSIKLDLGKPRETEVIKEWVTVSAESIASFFGLVRRETRQLVNRIGIVQATPALYNVDDCRFVCVRLSDLELQIYTIGLHVDGIGDIPWQYVPYGIKQELLGAT